MSNEHDGHRDRLRDRFLKEGLAHFEPHNALELLLFYSVPRADTNELAHRLIERFGSLSEVLNANPEELMKVPGVGKNTAVLLSMMPQLFSAYTNDVINSHKIVGSEAIEKYIVGRFCCTNSEKVLLVCLDNRFRMLSCDTVGEGSVNFSVVDRRRIVETVLRHNATAAMIAHNHPRGYALPSPEDVTTTSEIAKMLEGIGVRLIDHIIVCPDDYISLAQSRQFCRLFDNEIKPEEDGNGELFDEKEILI